MKRTVGIVGTGAIGGSIGMRARREGALVVGYDPDSGNLAQALEVGAIDFAATRDELYARANTVVIAAHVDATLEELRRLKNEQPVRAGLVIDVASVKEPVARAAAGLPDFVATHPMAGTHRSGVRAANATMFEGKNWIYVPPADPQLESRARAFIGSLGAAAIAMDAAEHDRVVAFTSHLTQLLASCYAELAREKKEDERFDALCGVTARELLRLGQARFPMWRDILQANAAYVEPDLRALGRALLEAADELAAGNVEALADRFV